MREYIGDVTLGVGAQARAVLALLADSEPDFDGNWDSKLGEYIADFHTAAWYNGRERGVVLWVRQLSGKKTLVVTLGECRSADSIFIDHAIADDIFLNPPTIQDKIADALYQSRRTVAPYRIDLAVDMVRELIARFLARGGE